MLTARRETELAQVAEGVPGALVVAGDITVEADRRRIVDTTTQRFGRIDVLVNNAGAAASGPAIDTSLDDFRAMIDTDLTAVFAITQLVGSGMIEAGRGSIINVASLDAERCLDRFPLAAYNAAKSGLVALSRSLASEWGVAASG